VPYSHVLRIFHTMGLAAHTMGLVAQTIGLAALLEDGLEFLVMYAFSIVYVCKLGGQNGCTRKTRNIESIMHGLICRISCMNGKYSMIKFDILLFIFEVLDIGETLILTQSMMKVKVNRISPGLLWSQVVQGNTLS
jgi:hypothetical protein